MMSLMLIDLHFNVVLAECWYIEVAYMPTPHCGIATELIIKIHCRPTQMAAATVTRKAEPTPPLEKSQTLTLNQ